MTRRILLSEVAAGTTFVTRGKTWIKLFRPEKYRGGVVKAIATEDNTPTTRITDILEMDDVSLVQIPGPQAPFGYIMMERAASALKAE